jgi:hypothetical protein
MLKIVHPVVRSYGNVVKNSQSAGKLKVNHGTSGYFQSQKPSKKKFAEFSIKC